MRINFIGGAYEGKSKNSNSQETINLYWDRDDVGGRQSMVKFPGLNRKLVIPRLLPTYDDDYTNLLAFRSTYNLTTDVVLAMTSTITESATSNQTITGTLTGMSSTASDNLYYDSFDIGFYIFGSSYTYKDTLAVTSAAATTAGQSISKSVDFGSDVGVKIMRLEKRSATTYAITGISIANGTFTIAGDHTAEFYYGRVVRIIAHSVMGTVTFDILKSTLSATDTLIYVKQTITDATVDGTLHSVDIYGEAYATRNLIRSSSIPRDNTTIATGDITENIQYQVVGDSYAVTYNSSTYTGGTGTQFFNGAASVTAYTTSGSGAVIERTSLEFFEYQAHVTRIEDQAMALVAAVAKRQQTDAENLVAKILQCQYPLAGSGTHSGNTGQFAYRYYTHGYNQLDYAILGAVIVTKTFQIDGDHTLEFIDGVSFTITGSTGNDGTYTVASSTLAGGDTYIVVDETVASATADGNIRFEKITAPQAHFRTGPAMTACYALGYFIEVYTTSTYVAQVKASIHKCLDHYADNYLIIAATDPRELFFTGGKGNYDLREPLKTFQSSQEPQWCSTWHNIMAWWAYRIAGEQSIGTSSSVLSGLGLTYATLVTSIGAKLIAADEDDGVWMSFKKRPVTGIAGIEVVQIDKTNKIIYLHGYMTNLMLVGLTFTIQGNTVAANNTTYTVVSSANDGTAIASGSIVSGRYYEVIGSITYENDIIYGTITNPAIFMGRSTATFTGTGTVTAWQCKVTVSETPDTAVTHVGALANYNGVACFMDRRSEARATAFYMPWAVAYGNTARAKDCIDFLAKYRVTDETYGTIVGYRSYLDGIREDFVEEDYEYIGDSTTTLIGGGYILPWSLTADQGYMTDTVSVEDTAAAMLAYMSFNDNHRHEKELQFCLVKARSLFDGEYPAARYDFVNWDYKAVEYESAILRPLQIPLMLNYASASATAWAMAAQNPRGFWDISPASLNVTGRSLKNAVRGMWVLGDYLYAVCGNIVVRFDTSDVMSLVSSTVMTTDSGWVSISDNSAELLFTEGVANVCYSYDPLTTTWTQLPTASGTFSGGKSATFQDGYLISPEVDGRNILWSDINAALTWDALNFIGATYSSDNIVVAISDKGELWVFKEKSVEIFRNTAGSALDPVFQRYPNGVLSVGCAAPGSVAIVDNTFYWLDNNNIIRKATGFNSIIVSPPQICAQLDTYTTVSDAVAFGYIEGGRWFYQISFPTEDVTWIYDVSTQQWYKRASYLEDLDEDGRHRANCYARFENMNLVGDYKQPYIYELDPEIYTDNEERILWKRKTAVVFDENDHGNFTISKLEVEFESGVGLQNGQGNDPQVIIRTSRDSGHTWSSGLWRGIGAVGEYGVRAIWRQLGDGRNRVFEISGSDPVKTIITGVYVNNVKVGGD